MNNVKRSFARFYIFAVLAVFGCGGEMDDLLCVTCGTYRMTYCLYNSSGHYSCEYMNVGQCNGTNYGKDNTCGGYGMSYASGESSSSSEPSSSSSDDVYIPGESSSSSEQSSSSLDDVYIPDESSDSSEQSSSSSDDVYIPDESSSSSEPSSSSSEASCDGINPLTQFCYNSIKIGNFCGINPQKYYNPDLYECRPNINPNGIFLKTGVPDDRDDKIYNAVLMGEQVWMATNLDYEIEGSRCNQDKPEYCAEYGRMYDWETALKACPSGWHLPSNAELNTLMKFINPSCSDDNSQCAGAGTKLKATSGWKGKSNQQGTDNYGFAALPGGFFNLYEFADPGDDGGWWSSSEYNANRAYYLNMVSGSSYSNAYRYDNDKGYLINVRCLQDY